MPAEDGWQVSFRDTYPHRLHTRDLVSGRVWGTEGCNKKMEPGPSLGLTPARPLLPVLSRCVSTHVPPFCQGPSHAGKLERESIFTKSNLLVIFQPFPCHHWKMCVWVSLFYDAIHHRALPGTARNKLVWKILWVLDPTIKLIKQIRKINCQCQRIIIKKFLSSSLFYRELLIIEKSFPCK